MKPRRVLLGMSGGVDSSVAAALLLREGCKVAGATLQLFKGGEKNEDAEKVSKQLGIEHFYADLSREFSENVIKYFVDSYFAGETPNPCMVCNRHLKFGALLCLAQERGFDAVATGHYARTNFDKAHKRWALRRGVSKKDQSYFLAQLSQQQLSRAVFPLGALEKPDVRRLAQKLKLPVADKPESQDICFVVGNDHVKFLEQFTKGWPARGNFLSENGEILGEHEGYFRYTVGQRKGLGAAFGRPMYVGAINAQTGDVVLVDGDRLFVKKMLVGKLNFVSYSEIPPGLEVDVKARSQAKLAPAKIFPCGDSLAEAKFIVPQRAIAPGQFAVFYEGDAVVASGKILKTL